MVSTRASRESNSRCRRRSSEVNKSVSINVVLPNNSDVIHVATSAKLTYLDVFMDVCRQIELEETWMFSLSKTSSAQVEFLDHDLQIPACMYKPTRQCKCNRDASGLHMLNFSVKYHVENLSVIRTERARQLYYLQLKENYLSLNAGYPDERCFLLSSYILHWELEEKSSGFDPRMFFPAWVVDGYGSSFILKHMPSIQPDLSSVQAREVFTLEASAHSPFTLACHTYHLNRLNLNGKLGQVRLGIGRVGLTIFELENGQICSTKLWSWEKIQEVSLNKNRIVISLKEKNQDLELSSESSQIDRPIFSLIRDIQDRLEKEITQRHSPLNDLQRFNESYIYSDQLDLEWETELSIMGTLPSNQKCQNYNTEKNLEDPRIMSRMSMVSATSSTTTSGIVCSRDQVAVDSSLNDSKDELLSISSPDWFEGASCDSLLMPSLLQQSTPKTSTITIQRATSAPNPKPAEMKLGIVKTRCLPRRAFSNQEFKHHTYENIAAVHEELGLNTPLPRNGKPMQTGTSHSKLRPTISRSFEYPASENRLIFHSSSPTQRYSFVFGEADSAEQVLSDYAPPPSYNQNHARQAEKILGVRRTSMVEDRNMNLIPRQSAKEASSCSDLDMSVRSADILPNMLLPKGGKPGRRPVSKSQDSTFTHSTQSIRSNSTESCTCQAVSHPEVNQIRGMADSLTNLPMLSALCNDKQLLKQSKHCQCQATPTQQPVRHNLLLDRPISCEPAPAGPQSSIAHNKLVDSRPLSWHCDANGFNLASNFKLSIDKSDPAAAMVV